MSNKRQKRHYQSASNIINFQPQNNNIKILPRNKNQESYMLKLMDPKKDIVFGIGPAGTGKKWNRVVGVCCVDQPVELRHVIQHLLDVLFVF